MFIYLNITSYRATVDLTIRGTKTSLRPITDLRNVDQKNFIKSLTLKLQTLTRELYILDFEIVNVIIPAFCCPNYLKYQAISKYILFMTPPILFSTFFFCQRDWNVLYYAAHDQL